MKIKIYLFLAALSCILIVPSPLKSGDDAYFDELFAELLAEIEEEEARLGGPPPPPGRVPPGPAPIEPPAKPKDEKKDLPESEKEATPYENFIQDFVPGKAEHKGLTKGQKPRLPDFKRAALEHYLSELEDVFIEMKKALSGLDPIERKNFEEFFDEFNELDVLLSKVKSKRPYREALFDKSFGETREIIAAWIGTRTQPGPLVLLAHEIKPLPAGMSKLISQEDEPLAKSQAEEDALGLLKLPPLATAREVLGLKDDQTLEDAQDARDVLLAKWRDDATLTKLIKEAYREVALKPHKPKEPLPERREDYLDRLRQFLASEVQPLISDLEEVIKMSKKPLDEIKKFREKKIKDAEARRKRTRRTSGPGYFPSYGGFDNWGDARGPMPGRQSGSGGRGFSGGGPGGGYGGGFGRPSGFGDSPFDDLDDEKKPSKGEPPAPKAPKPKAPKKDKKESADLNKEKNLKKDLIGIAKELKKKPSDSELQSKFDSLQSSLEDVSRGLPEGRKKKKDWQNLEKEYRKAISGVRKGPSTPGAPKKPKRPKTPKPPKKTKEELALEGLQTIDRKKQEVINLSNIARQSADVFADDTEAERRAFDRIDELRSDIEGMEQEAPRSSDSAESIELHIAYRRALADLADFRSGQLPLHRGVEPPPPVPPEALPEGLNELRELQAELSQQLQPLRAPGERPLTVEEHERLTGTMQRLGEVEQRIEEMENEAARTIQ